MELKDIERRLEESRQNGYKSAEKNNIYIHVILLITSIFTFALLVWHNRMATNTTIVLEEMSSTQGELDAMKLETLRRMEMSLDLLVIEQKQTVQELKRR